MDTYDFNRIIDRRGTDCAKWDDYPGSVQAEDILPMWTADMDFACPPPVMEALQKRLEHPVFGYYALPERYTDCIIRWRRTRFGCETRKEDIVPVASVLGGVAMAIQALSREGDGVMVNTPGYHAFFDAIHNNRRTLVTSPLIRRGDRFTMDFAHMEQQMQSGKVRIFILCSPHNPTGRIWTEQELCRVVELCSRYGVYLVSDEIHADMTLTHPFTPLPGITGADPSDIAVCLYAPTKTFNIAGLCTAYAVIRDPEIRDKFRQALLASGLKVKNTLGVEALMAAYDFGGPWVDSLQEYLLDNARFAVDFIEKQIPRLHAYVPEATYFLWLDFSATGMTGREFTEGLAEQAHVILTPGDDFLDGGEHCVRLVYACPRALLEDALNRIKTFLS